MKYLKFALINLVVFGVLFFSLSLLFPSRVVTSKTIAIVAKPEQVSKILQQPQLWKKWNLMATDSQTTARVKNISGDTIIEVTLVRNGRALENHFNMQAVPGDSCIVNYSLLQQLPWYKPWVKMAALFTEGKYSQPVDQSLSNLKLLIEHPQSN
ncbi:MAG: hypothetical protein RLY16_1878 [Bacteroidota bacterium]